MGKYGDAAVQATEMLHSDASMDPREAWDLATAKVFPTQLASRSKGCPKGAFLGLCEDGVVRGVAPGSYTRSRLNKSYALEAVLLLKANRALADDYDALWRAVMRGTKKVENEQMDVVLSLWERGLINIGGD